VRHPSSTTAVKKATKKENNRSYFRGRKRGRGVSKDILGRMERDKGRVKTGS